MPKKINDDVKARGLRLLETHAREYPSVSAAAEVIAKQLGVGKETVRRWAVQAQIDAGHQPGVTTEESKEIKRLRAENRRLQEDVEILKAATTFFAGALDPRNR